MSKKHLPVIGVGPLIVTPPIILTASGIYLATKYHWEVGRISYLRIPMLVLGVLLIVAGVWIWYCANYRDKVFDCITENHLLTTGVYSYVRNPIYSAFF